MRKTFALLLTAAFVASMPSIASAKKMKRHKHHRQVVVQNVDPGVATGRFVGNALYQLVVPLEATFGSRRYQ